MRQRHIDKNTVGMFFDRSYYNMVEIAKTSSDSFICIMVDVICNEIGNQTYKPCDVLTMMQHFYFYEVDAMLYEQRNQCDVWCPDVHRNADTLSRMWFYRRDGD